MAEDTVTIARSEYERLKRIEKLFLNRDQPIDEQYIKRLREDLDKYIRT